VAVTPEHDQADSGGHDQPEHLALRGRIAPDTHPLESQRLALHERADPGCDPLSIQALIWLFRAYNAAYTAHADELRPLGLSTSAFNVLMALRNTPGEMLEPHELSERLLVTRPSISGLLDTLQTKGLIARTPAVDDRRRVHVRLTPAGRELLERHAAAHARCQDELFADLSPDERAQLVVLLRRIRGACPPSLSPSRATGRVIDRSA
jgi:DNA-binding MarR family transcriptional regulator